MLPVALIDEILPLILPVPNYRGEICRGDAIRMKKKILKYRLTCRVFNDNMDKAVSRLPELSYLLFIDKMGLYYDVIDNCLRIEPFLRDVRVRDALRDLHCRNANVDDQDRLIWEPTSLALAEILTMPREVTIFSTIFICAANAERLFPLIIKHLKQMHETNANLFIPYEVIEIEDCGDDHYLYMKDELILEFFHLMKELSQGKCNLGQSLCCSKCQYIEFDRMNRESFLSKEWSQMPCTLCGANINTDIFCNECINPCSCYEPYRDIYYKNNLPGNVWWEEGGCKSLICNDCLEKTNEGKNWTSPRCIERARKRLSY